MSSKRIELLWQITLIIRYNQLLSLFYSTMPRSTPSKTTPKTTPPKKEAPVAALHTAPQGDSATPGVSKSFSTASMVRFWLIGALFVCLGYWFYQSLNIVYLIISSLIISISTEGMILAFEKRVKSRGLAIGLSYLLLLLFVFSGVFFVIPFLISQVSLLISWFSKVIISISQFVVNNPRPAAIHQISWLPEMIKEYLINNRQNFNRSNTEFQSAILSGLNSLLESSTTYLKQFSASIFSVIGGFFGMMANLAIVFTMAIFFSIEKDYLINLIVKSTSKAKRSLALTKVKSMYHKLSLWLKARVLLSLFVTVAMYLAFWVMKLFGLEIPNMFSLSLITGLLDIVPYVGPVFSIIPVLVLALIHNGFWGMLIAGAVFFLVQWLQNNVITPLLMEKQLGVNSVLILVSAMLGATVMGFWGIVLSVPLAVIVGLFIDEDDPNASA
ncbi:MAG: AI-2E family transporter [bacterium]|nr:AI-2E family transporter [bacterium]